MQKNMGVPWNKGHTPSSAHASILYSFHLDFPSFSIPMLRLPCLLVVGSPIFLERSKLHLSIKV